jgi:hypothetical protein
MNGNKASTTRTFTPREDIADCSNINMNVMGYVLLRLQCRVMFHFEATMNTVFKYFPVPEKGIETCFRVRRTLEC